MSHISTPKTWNTTFFSSSPLLLCHSKAIYESLKNILPGNSVPTIEEQEAISQIFRKSKWRGKKKASNWKYFHSNASSRTHVPLALIPFKALRCLRTDFHHNIGTLLLWSLVQVVITTDFQIIGKSKPWICEPVTALEYLMTTTPVPDKSSCRCVGILTNYKRNGDLLMGKNRTISANLKSTVKYIVIGVF